MFLNFHYFKIIFENTCRRDIGYTCLLVLEIKVIMQNKYSSSTKDIGE